MDYNNFLISGKLKFIQTGKTNNNLTFAYFTLESYSKKYPNMLSFVSYGLPAEQLESLYSLEDNLLVSGRIRSKQVEDRIFPIFIVEKINKINEPRREGKNTEYID